MKHKPTEEELKTLAEKECKKVLGGDEEEWDAMYSGNQSAMFDSFIAGYFYATKDDT